MSFYLHNQGTAMDWQNPTMICNEPLLDPMIYSDPLLDPTISNEPLLDPHMYDTCTSYSAQPPAYTVSCSTDPAQLDTDSTLPDTADWWLWSQLSTPDNGPALQQDLLSSSYSPEEVVSSPPDDRIEELHLKIIELERKAARLDELERRFCQLDEAEQHLSRIEEMQHRLRQLEVAAENHYAQSVAHTSLSLFQLLTHAPDTPKRRARSVARLRPTWKNGPSRSSCT
jgi:hypothetical protein